jgi:hypothetical protein
MSRGTEFLRKTLTTCGFNQVSRVYFTESFAPFLNDLSFSFMLIANLVWDMTSVVADIEAALLHCDLDEEIHIDVPMGLSTGPNTKIIVGKAIYGLVLIDV